MDKQIIGTNRDEEIETLKQVLKDKQLVTDTDLINAENKVKLNNGKAK